MIKKPYLWWVIGIGIMVLILSKIDLSNTFLIFSTAKVLYLPLIFLLIIPLVLVMSFRWQYLLKMQQIDYSFKDSQQVYTNGTVLVPLFRVLDAIEQKGEEYQSCQEGGNK